MATATVARPTCADVIPDPRELRRVITESARAPHRPRRGAHRPEPGDVDRGAARRAAPNVVRVMLAAFLEAHAR